MKLLHCIVNMEISIINIIDNIFIFILKIIHKFKQYTL